MLKYQQFHLAQLIGIHVFLLPEKVSAVRVGLCMLTLHFWSWERAMTVGKLSHLPPEQMNGRI